MLQLDVALCRTRDNVAHKVRRYIHFFVALGGVISTKRSITPPKELVSDVERFVPDRVHVRQARPDATTFFRSSGGCNKHQTEYYTPQGVYLRRWLGLGPDVKGAPPRPGVRAIVVFTQRRNPIPLAKLLCPVPANGGWRLRRISTFLPEASFKV